MARAALQGCPLGLKGIVLLLRGWLRGWGGWSDLRWSSPAVRPIKGHTAIGWLQGSGVYRGGLRWFDERADVTSRLTIVLGGRGDWCGEWLRLRG